MVLILTLNVLRTESMKLRNNSVHYPLILKPPYETFDRYTAIFGCRTDLRIYEGIEVLYLNMSALHKREQYTRLRDGKVSSSGLYQV